jgi:hypothetical protein
VRDRDGKRNRLKSDYEEERDEVEGGDKECGSGKEISDCMELNGGEIDWTLARECNREKVKCCGEGNGRGGFIRM